MFYSWIVFSFLQAVLVQGLTKTGEGLMGVLSYSLSPGSSQDLSGLDISLFSLP